MNFEEWETTVPKVIRDDALWKVQAYRLGLFLSDLAWVDCGKLMRNVRSVDIADQLGRAVRKISNCVAEGYSRGSGKFRATYYEYALGSTREARDLYYKGRHVLKETVTSHRIALCSKLVRLLIRMTADERKTNWPLTRPPPT